MDEQSVGIHFFGYWRTFARSYLFESMCVCMHVLTDILKIPKCRDVFCLCTNVGKALVVAETEVSTLGSIGKSLC